VIHSLTANIGLFKYCNSLVHFYLRGANVLTLESNEHYFRLRNRALAQDSHSLRGSTHDLWTVQIMALLAIYHLLTFPVLGPVILLKRHTRKMAVFWNVAPRVIW
jgi:hypothetical protein